MATLLEVAKTETNPQRKAVIEMIASSHPLMQRLDFLQVDGNAYSYSQEETLGGVAFRGINESYTPDTGIVNPLTERLAVLGGELDVDTMLVKAHGMDFRANQIRGKLKNMVHNFADTFVKGDSETDPRQPDGLQKRIIGNQLIDNSAAGGALSLMMLDEAIDSVDECNAILCSQKIRRRLTQAVRGDGSTNSPVGGQISISEDAFGKQVTHYAGRPLIEMDQNSAVYKTLAFNEAAKNGGSTFTSMYPVSLSMDMLAGLQNGGIDVDDFGRIQAKPVYRMRAEWMMSFALLHGRCASRLRGIADAAIVA